MKISSATGGEKELKIGDNATITRDGTQAGLDQLKEGDQVRASLDPSSNQATKLEITSSSKMDSKSDSSSSKSDTSSKSDSSSSKSDDSKSDSSKKY